MSTLAENALDENSPENEVATPLRVLLPLSTVVSTYRRLSSSPPSRKARGPRPSSSRTRRGVVYHILVSEYPAVESVNPAPDPGFDMCEVL